MLFRRTDSHLLRFCKVVTVFGTVIGSLWWGTTRAEERKKLKAWQELLAARGIHASLVSVSLHPTRIPMTFAMKLDTDNALLFAREFHMKEYGAQSEAVNDFFERRKHDMSQEVIRFFKEPGTRCFLETRESGVFLYSEAKKQGVWFRIPSRA